MTGQPSVTLQVKYDSAVGIPMQVLDVPCNWGRPSPMFPDESGVRLPVVTLTVDLLPVEEFHTVELDSGWRLTPKPLNFTMYCSEGWFTVSTDYNVIALALT